MLEQLVGQALGRYQLDQLLGEGGMGAVFKAHDPTLGRAVALKVMLPNLAQQPGFRERFLQEARVAAQLKHPGIVQVYDFGQACEHLFIVMAFVPGDNLYQLLQRLKGSGQELELGEAVRLVRQICLALDYAHRQGVLHRDIKPSNIMLEPEAVEGLPYRPVITDLGLAKLLEGGLMTMSGASLGTPAYMSPEAAQGEPTDARSDIYSLGVLLYELTVGQLPFPIKTLTQALRYHTKEAPPPPRSLRSDLPAALEQVILKALAKAADDRFATAAALAQALEQILPTLAPPTASPTVRPTHVSLLTHYQQSLVAPRGASILEEIPTPSDLSHASISVLAPDGVIHTQPLTGRTLTIGRNADNDVVVDDEKASRHHVRVECDGQTYKVFDLDSRNGTFLANVKLLPGVPEVWPPNKALRIGKHWLRLTQAQALANHGVTLANGTLIDSSKLQSSSGATHVGLFLAQTEFTVQPGGNVAIPLIVLNQGLIVDHFIVSVEGVPTHWVSTPPPPLQLMPGEQQTLTLIIQPPRSPNSRAGEHALTVRVASQNAPEQVAEMKRALTVGAYHQSHSELKPAQLPVDSSGDVIITNQGNSIENVTVNWSDRADELIFTPASSRLEAPADQKTSARFQAKLRQRRWIGGRRLHPFSVQVTLPGETQVLQGEITSKGVIPVWLPPAALAALAALIIVVWRFFTQPPEIVSVSYQPAAPLAGQPVTIYWSVNRADTVELSPLGIHPNAADGKYTFEKGLPGNQSLTLVAHNRFGRVEKPLNIAPGPGPEPVIEKWSVTPSTVNEGESVSIEWQVKNAENVMIEPVGTVQSEGRMSHKPLQTQTYTLIATNQGKTVKRSAEVAVVTPKPGAPVISVFSAEPAEFVRGALEKITLNWKTERTDTVTIEPGLGTVGLAGSRPVPAPEQTTTYTLVAKGSGGETTREVYVKVGEPSHIPDNQNEATNNIKIYGFATPRWVNLIQTAAVQYEQLHPDTQIQLELKDYDPTIVPTVFVVGLFREGIKAATVRATDIFLTPDTRLADAIQVIQENGGEVLDKSMLADNYSLILVGMAPESRDVYQYLQSSSVAKEPSTGSKTRTIGSSVRGNALDVVEIGQGERYIIFVGGLHAGSAPSTVALAHQAADYYSTHATEIPAGVTLSFVLNANPDVRRAPGTLEGRLNANGVDLNRNWGCNWNASAVWRNTPVSGGANAFSEPESQALSGYFTSHPTVAVVFWEARIENGQVSAGGCGERSLVSQPLAKTYGSAAGYSVEPWMYYPVTGDATNWLDSQGIPAISVLLRDYEDTDWSSNLKGIHAVLEVYGR